MGRRAVPERRVAALVMAVAVAAFLVAVIVGGPYFRSFDEAKYVGIGYSMLSGEGPRTVFGALFLPHSPLWPVLIAAPDVWFGIDAFAVGQLLNAIAGVALLGMVGWLGWRIRPLVGALAVAAYVGVPYLADLTRTARLDVPAAALALAYVLVGFEAVRRGSAARGLIAGAIFALAFCVKEIVLPLAPVPFLAGLLIGTSVASLLRVSAATVLVAAVGTSWWFLLVASLTDRVYRLGVPARYLPFLYLGLAAFVVGAWLLSRRLRRAGAGQGSDPRAGSSASTRRRVVAWGMAVVWFAALAVFFDRTTELQGVGLVTLGQWKLYVQTWLPSLPLVALAAATAVGAVIAILDRVRGGGGATEWVDLILLTLLCSAPLVMLVIAVGEPPRNYLAQIGLLLVLASAGWLRVAEVLVARLRPASEPVTAAPGTTDEQRQPTRNAGAAPLRPLLAGLAIVLLAGSLAVAGVHALASRATASGGARADATAWAASWIEANVPPGTRIGFGSYLGYETAVDLGARYPMVQIHQSLAVLDPKAPLGLSLDNQRTIDDWVAIDTSRREQELYAFRGSAFQTAVQRSRIAYYVYITGPNTSVPALLASLTPEHGFTPVAHQDFPSRTSSGAGATAVDVFAVDPARVDLGGAPFAATPEALNRLVDQLVANPATEPSTARTLIDRATTWPDPSAAGPILDRLRPIAGP